MESSPIIVCHAAERVFVSINDERRHVFHVKGRASVSMDESVLNAFHAKGAESVYMSELNPPVRSAKEVPSVIMVDSEWSVKNVAGVPFANMVVIDTPVANAMVPESVNMENEKHVVVTVEAYLYVNMIANVPNASPMVDHHIVNMTYFVALALFAHQRSPVSIVIWFM
jgi:hypothetical protein